MGGPKGIVVSLAACGMVLAGCLAPGPSGLDAAAAARLGCLGPCQLTIDGGDENAREPMLAVDPSDPMHLVAASQLNSFDSAGLRRSWVYSYVSRDGGATWEVAPIPGGSDAPEGHPLAGAMGVSDQVAVVLADGRVLYAGLATDRLTRVGPAFAAQGVTLFVARSDDGGLTYPEVTVLDRAEGALALVNLPEPLRPLAPVLGTDTVAATVLFHDKPWMTSGPDGTVLLVWSTHLAPPAAAELRWSATTDQGQTWSAPTVLVGPDGSYWGAHPAISADGSWHVAFIGFDAAGLVDSIQVGAQGFPLSVATSRDRGATWDVRTADPDVPALFPQLGASLGPEGRPRLSLAYSAFAGNGMEAPVFRTSDDGGATWSEPLVLDVPEYAGTWTMPTLAVGADGTSYVSFYRYEAEDRLSRRLVTVRDGAVAGSVVLDDEVEGRSVQGAALGDYQGLVALPDGAFAVWVTRAGEAIDLLGARLAWG